MLKNSEKSNDKENFIYKCKQHIKLVRDKIKSFVEFLSTKTKHDLVEEDQYTLIQELRSWLLDILLYGILISIVYNTFFGWSGWFNFALIPAFGLARWFVFDSIKKYREL